MRENNNYNCVDYYIKKEIGNYTKIVFIIEHLSNGGAERITSILANGLSKRENVKAFILTYSIEKMEYELCKNVKKISYEKRRKRKMLSTIERIKWLKHIINEIRPQYVISLGMPNTQIQLRYILSKRKFKLILSERNNPAVHPKQFIYRVLIKMAYISADGVVFQTNDARDYFSDKIRNHSTVIGNPIIENLPYKSNKDENVIVNFCRLSPQKNIPCLLRAFAIVYKKHPEYKLVIYGNGELLEELISYSKVLNIEMVVRFETFTNEIHDIIKDYSIFVSSSDYEGISNSMMEAMAIGLPVVCTDCPIGGARMVIKNGENGLLVPVNDEVKMANAIIRLIEDKNFAQKLGHNAIRVRDTFNIDNICNKWYEFIKEC